jgi:hypothetical protein
MTTRSGVIKILQTVIVALQDGYPDRALSIGKDALQMLLEQEVKGPTAKKDQIWLNEMCELVENKIPPSHSFVVFAFPRERDGQCYYGSNATRETVVYSLHEWLKFQEQEGNWGKHT